MPKFQMGASGAAELSKPKEGGDTAVMIDPTTKKAVTVVNPLAPITDFDELVITDKKGKAILNQDRIQYYKEPSESVKALPSLFSDEEQEHLLEVTAEHELPIGMLASFAKIRDFEKKIDILDDSGSMSIKDTGVKNSNGKILSRAEELVKDQITSASIDIALGIPNLTIKSLNGLVNYQCSPQSMTVDQRKAEITKMTTEVNKLKPYLATPLNQILSNAITSAKTLSGKTLITVSTDGAPSDFSSPPIQYQMAGYTDSNANIDTLQLNEAKNIITNNINTKINNLNSIILQKPSQIAKYQIFKQEAQTDLTTLNQIFSSNPPIAELFTLVALRNIDKSHIHFSACTGDENAVGYLNILDRYCPNVSTTDDAKSEIKEMLHFQGGLFPAKNMVIAARKLGFLPEIDKLDEVPTTIEQLSNIVGHKVEPELFKIFEQQAGLAQELDLKKQLNETLNTHPLDEALPKYSEKNTVETVNTGKVYGSNNPFSRASTSSLFSRR